MTAPLRLAVDNTAGRLPPHDLDHEAALLGAVLYDPDRFAVVRATGLEPKHFYSQPNGLVWDAALELDAAGQTVDLVAIRSRLADRQLIQTVGGSKYLGDLAMLTPATNEREAARRVIDLWRVRRAITASQRFCARAYNREWGPDGPQELLVAASRYIRDVAMTDTGQTGTIRLTDAILAGLREQEALKAEPVRETPFPRLNHLIGGGLRNECIGVLANEGVGKSSLTRQIGLHVAQTPDDDGELRTGLGIVALEMPAEQVAMLAASQLAKIDAEMATKGQFTTSGIERFNEAWELWCRMPVLINDEAKGKPGRPAKPVTVERLRDIIREMRADFELAGQRLAVVVVDLIQCVAPNPGQSDFDAIKAASRMLRDLPCEVGCTIFVVSHTNGKGEAWGYPKLRGDMECLWRLQVAEDDEPKYAGPPRNDPPRATAEFELIVEKMRIPCAEPTPATVTLRGNRSTLNFEEGPNA